MSYPLIFESSGKELADFFRPQVIFCLRFIFGSLGFLVGAILVGREEVIFIGVIAAIVFICFVYAVFTNSMRWAFRFVWNPHRCFRLRLGEAMIEQELAGYLPIQILRSEVDKVFEGRGGLLIQSRMPKRSIVVPSIMPIYEEMSLIIKPWGTLMVGQQIAAKSQQQILSRPLILLRLLGALIFVFGLLIYVGQISLLFIPFSIGLLLVEMMNGVLIWRSR